MKGRSEDCQNLTSLANYFTIFVMPTMNVSLTPELADLVKKKVSTGLYGNSSEVVRAALRLMVEREGAGEEAEWRGRIQHGLAQADRGEFVEGRVSDIIAAVKAAK